MSMVGILPTSLGIRHEDVLVTPRLPGRIGAVETARLLGFKEHDIPFLIRAGLLKPLGNPTHSAPKWFAAIEIEEHRNDRKFLDKATKIIANQWRTRNSAKTKTGEIQSA